MSSGLIDTTAHPLSRMVGELELLAEDSADAAAWSMADPELADALVRLERARRRFEATTLRMLAEADRRQLGAPVGAGSTAGWWASQTQKSRPAAHREVGLARQLDDGAHPTASAALAAGAASTDQAGVIANAVQALPSDLVPPPLRAEVEGHLVELATRHDPRELRILGRKALEVLAPEVAEEAERRLLEDEERRAAAAASFTMRADGHGSMRGRFSVPALAGEILAKHLAALAAPRRRAATPSGGTGAGELALAARHLRLGEAFVEYIETRGADSTPTAGGVPATVVVTMTLENLLGGSARAGGERAATLDTGERISAGEARRLACEARLIPAVLGTASQPLDLGRKARFHNAAQRQAMALRDRGCAAEDCDWPPAMCHAHHPTPWSRGGGTSVANGVLLCPRHHRLAHDSRYQLKTDQRGRVLFSRRT